MKRYLALLAALLIMLLMITGCNNNSTPDAADTSADTTAPETAPGTPVDIVKDGASDYTIVRSDQADENTVNASLLILNSLKKYTGVSPKITTDWIKKGDTHDAAALEILIGHTNYAESSEVLQDLPYGDYIIKQVGNKLVINAWSPKALNRAVTVLISNMMKNATEGNFSLPANVLITGSELAEVNLLPVYENASLETIYPSGNDSQLLLFSDTDQNEYEVYLKALEAKGFSLYTRNDITDNCFATYVNDDYTVTAGYYGYKNEARIILEPRDALPALEAEEYETVTQPMFAMLGLEFDNGQNELSQNGQCFVWQLSDGSYIVVDGGFSRSQDAAQLLNFMQRNSPDRKNVTVAAWIITHAHGDHYGAFSQFSSMYSKYVNVEKILVNFLSDDARKADDMAEGGGYTHVTKYENSYANCELINVHVGQKFYIRDAEIEFLYTIESYVPRSLDGYFNTTSLVFTVELAGQRFLVTGDASDVASSIISGMFREYLQSDFVQAAHHGYQAGLTSSVAGIKMLYSYAAAPYVLWPVGDQDYATMNTRPQSLHLQTLPSTKEIFVAGSAKTVLPLPYTPGASDSASTSN